MGVSFHDPSPKRNLIPSDHHYAQEKERHTELTPKEFWKRCRLESDAALLGETIRLYQVLEIDDGLQPVCVYKSQTGYRVVSLFNTETERKNWKEAGKNEPPEEL